ncbi:hypothetical protein DRH14_04655, partial [Candidatus Shapirobacteria bacterium]
LKSESNLLAGIFDKRFEYFDIFSKVKSLFPDGVKLDSFELEGKRSFVLNGSTIDLKSLDKVEEMVADIERGKNKDFRRVKLMSVDVEDGHWNFKMEAFLR